MCRPWVPTGGLYGWDTSACAIDKHNFRYLFSTSRTQGQLQAPSPLALRLIVHHHQPRAANAATLQTGKSPSFSLRRITVARKIESSSPFHDGLALGLPCWRCGQTHDCPGALQHTLRCCCAAPNQRAAQRCTTSAHNRTPSMWRCLTCWVASNQRASLTAEAMEIAQQISRPPIAPSLIVLGLLQGTASQPMTPADLSLSQYSA